MVKKTFTQNITNSLDFWKKYEEIRIKIEDQLLSYINSEERTKIIPKTSLSKRKFSTNGFYRVGSMIIRRENKPFFQTDFMREIYLASKLDNKEIIKLNEELLTMEHDVVLAQKGLALFYAKQKYHGNPNEISLQEAINEALYGLLLTVYKYDYRSPAKFSSLAFFWIRQRLTKLTWENGNLVKIPNELISANLKDASVLLMKSSSLSASVDGETGDSFEDFLVSKNDTEKEYASKELSQRVQELLKKNNLLFILDFQEEKKDSKMKSKILKELPRNVLKKLKKINNDYF
jgi:DNA-directed RNA polymerase sigma subunit (sigma70/sigma32)